jgi:hypothetical protein
MYHIKANRGSVSTDFINGYLASIALFKNVRDGNLDFMYYFHEYPKNGASATQVMATIIQREIDNSSFAYSEFAKNNGTTIQQTLQSDFLKPQMDWKNTITPVLTHWLNNDWLQLFGKKASLTWPPNEFLITTFTDILESFFINTSFIMYTFDSEMDALLGQGYFWGLNYADFVFDTENMVYHLHFDCID